MREIFSMYLLVQIWRKLYNGKAVVLGSSVNTFVRYLAPVAYLIIRQVSLLQLNSQGNIQHMLMMICILVQLFLINGMSAKYKDIKTENMIKELKSINTFLWL
jgi:hypothetical protein